MRFGDATNEPVITVLADTTSRGFSADSRGSQHVELVVFSPVENEGNILTRRNPVTTGRLGYVPETHQLSAGRNVVETARSIHERVRDSIVRAKLYFRFRSSVQSHVPL